MVSTIKLGNKVLLMPQLTAGGCNKLIMSDKKYFHQCAKSLIFHVENGLKMQFNSKGSDIYEFLLCFRLKCRIKYSDFYIDISIINR